MWESLGRDFLEIAIEQAGNVQKLAEITGIPRSTIQRWQSGKSDPSLSKFGAVMSYIGVLPQRVGQDKAEPISFAKVEFEGQKVPSDDYLAVPVLKDPNRIEGSELFVPATNIEAVALPLADSKELGDRPHTVAVVVEDKAMSPLLDPGDLVYIDRADTAVHGAGDIFLVRDAKEDKVCIRRVHEYQEDGETFLLFTADNPKTPPAHFSVTKHYGGDRSQAILGRAYNAKVDLTNM
jgi:transcriptional regulator with XRE-family HTH domain